MKWLDKKNNNKKKPLLISIFKINKQTNRKEEFKFQVYIDK